MKKQILWMYNWNEVSDDALNFDMYKSNVIITILGRMVLK